MVPAPFGGRTCCGLCEGQCEMEPVLLREKKRSGCAPMGAAGTQCSTHWVCSQNELVEIGLPYYYDLQWKYFTNHIHCGVGAFKTFYPSYRKKERLRCFNINLELELRTLQLYHFFHRWVSFPCLILVDNKVIFWVFVSEAGHLQGFFNAKMTVL